MELPAGSALGRVPGCPRNMVMWFLPSSSVQMAEFASIFGIPLPLCGAGSSLPAAVACGGCSYQSVDWLMPHEQFQLHPALFHAIKLFGSQCTSKDSSQLAQAATGGSHFYLNTPVARHCRCIAVPSTGGLDDSTVTAERARIKGTDQHVSECWGIDVEAPSPSLLLT